MEEEQEYNDKYGRGKKGSYIIFIVKSEDDKGTYIK